tara:strand:- start:2354 stop:3052 length:699 start_codon:yes stop_codon:yes gene_type:complete
MSTCVIIQPSYIPWRGYFHQIQLSDTFVFYDDVQYDKHGWRNRNKVKGPNGSQWLTIPVLSKGCVVDRFPINQARIKPDSNWAAKHWQTLTHLYGKTPYFDKYAHLLQTCFESPPALLCDFTINLTMLITRALGLGDKQFVRSSTLNITGDRSSRLVNICKHFGAKAYLTGPSAHTYLDEELFNKASIRIEYMEYQYAEYEQIFPPFDPFVSILDLMFMTGPDAPRHIWEKQ